MPNWIWHLAMTQETDPPTARLDVVDRTPFSGLECPSSPGHHWHPKLTGYRIFVLILPGGFSVVKAILTYRGKLTGVSITLEWVLSVVVFLV
jgi:hypothetical protein